MREKKGDEFREGATARKKGTDIAPEVKN